MVTELVKKEEQSLKEVKGYAELTTEEKQKVFDIITEINITDTQSVIQFGTNAQTKISEFSDTILNNIKAKDAGETGKALTGLMVNIKELNVDDLNQPKGFLSKVFGGAKNNVSKFISQYDKVSVHIERILIELDKAKMELIKDITVLDNLYQRNLEFLHDLDFYIIAGELKLKDLNENTLPQLKQKAQESGSMEDAQKVNDFLQLVTRFEKKVHDLKLSRMVAIQTAPQIRIIQNNNQILAEKIQSSILNTIPLWKNQVIIAISLFRQEKALNMQKEVTDTTNELLMKNSEMLKQNSIEVARESEKGIIEIETLRKINNDLIETIDESIRIQQEGKAKRQEAEKELSGLEEQLKNRLTQVSR